MEPYQYTQIDSSEIRCITLAPNQEPHRGQLSTCSRDEGQYCALSYEWGDSTSRPDRSIDITEDGSISGRICVTRNLHNALSDLTTLSVEPKTFFIDQISINQADNAEKSAQVAGMGDVYRQAQMVRSYLGPQEEGDIIAMDLLQRISDHFGQWYDECVGKTIDWDSAPDKQSFQINEADAGALQHLATFVFSGGWTRRLWMTQEVLLSDRLFFLKGSILISSRLVFLLRVCHTLLPELGEPPKPGHDHASAMGISYRSIRRNDGFQSFLHLMDSFGSRFDCRDSRDTIYSLLGLARDSFDIQPDYDIQVVDLFTEFAKRAIEGMTSLRIFDYVYRDSTPLQRPKKAMPDSVWPTWVPAFEEYRGPVPPIANLATGFSIPIVIYECDEYQIENMVICGHQIGIVKRVFVKFDPGSDPWSAERETLDRFLRGIEEVEKYYLSIGREDFYAELCHTLLGQEKSISPDHTDAEWNKYAAIALCMALEFLREAQRTSVEGFANLVCSPADTDMDPPKALLIQKILDSICVDNQCLCMTEQGDLVKTPGAVEAGDVVVLFFGGSEAYALRPYTSEAFQLLGTCYLSGYMSGEILSDEEWEEDFRLIVLNALDEPCANYIGDVIKSVATEE